MKKNKVGKQKNVKFVIFCLLLTISTAAIDFSLLAILDWVGANAIEKNKLADYKSSITVTKNQTNEILTNPAKEDSIDITGEKITKNQIADYEHFANLPFYEVDFQQLAKDNPDIIAFIHMDSLDISYPIVQKKNDDKDNPYYLTHDISGNQNEGGWIYADIYSNLNPIGSTNPYGTNTVIYGHERGETSILSSLRNTLTKEWQSDMNNYAMWISTPEQNYVLQIFSVYTIYPESYYTAGGFTNTKVKETWYKTMKKRSTLPHDVFLDVNDTILTISSAPDDFSNRIVIQAKIIKTQSRQKES